MWGPAAREKDYNRTLRTEVAVGIDTLNQKNKKMRYKCNTQTCAHVHTHTHTHTDFLRPKKILL